MANENNRRSNSTGTGGTKLNTFQRIKGHVQGKTLDGLIALVPLLVSAVVLFFIIGWADQFVRPLAFVAGRPWDFPGIGLIVGIVIFYLVGMLISTSFGRTLMTWKNAVLENIPVVKTIYVLTQQATQLMTSQSRFTRVVFLEWPREGMVAVGFVTGRAYREKKEVEGRRRTQVVGRCVHPHRPQSDVGEPGVRYGRRPDGDGPDGGKRHEAGVLRRDCAAGVGIPRPVVPSPV